jgi:hypothetical protein
MRWHRDYSNVPCEIFPKEHKSRYNKNAWTPMFSAALFTIAKLWKQSRCSITDEWIKKSIYMYYIDSYYIYMRCDERENVLFSHKEE